MALFRRATTATLVVSLTLDLFLPPSLETGKKKTGIARAVGPHPPAAFFGQQAVFRVSLASCLFFSGMSLATSRARFKGDEVDRSVQHGAWGAKLCCWLLLTLGAFFLPVGLVAAYGWLARLGSALFLGVQILMLLDFVCELNDSLVDAAGEAADGGGGGGERYLWGLLGLSGICYAGAAALVAVSLYFFNPGTAPGEGAAGGGGAQDCSFNVAVVVAAPLGGLAVSALALSGVARRGSLFPSAALTLYACYCTYSALVSEPHGYRCNALGRRIDAASATGMLVAVGATLGSVAYSALRAGSNASLLGLGPGAAESEGSLDGGATPLISRGRGRYGYENDDDAHLTSSGLDGVSPAGARALPGSSSGGGDRGGTADISAAAISSSSSLPAVPVSYSYPFFHAVFALASMHVAMLFSGYGSGAAERALVDVGWPSVGVKLTCAWVSLGVYAWTLVAPALFPDRVF